MYPIYRVVFAVLTTALLTAAPLVPADDEPCDTERLKAAAIDALISAPPERAMPIVTRVLRGNESDEIKEKALFVLSQIETQEARDLLLDGARTGSQDSRGRSLSLFIVDKARPGVRVALLPTVDGDQLKEVFFDDVHVPVAQRVGEEHAAWPIVGEALASERHIQFPPGRVRRDLDEMVAWVSQAGLATDAVVRRALTDLAVEVAEVEMHGLRVLDAMQKGRPAVAEAAANKIVHTQVCQRIARAIVEFGGPAALVSGSRPELLWRQSMWETIGGGTSEIMRGVVAKQALGLEGRR